MTGRGAQTMGLRIGISRSKSAMRYKPAATSALLTIWLLLTECWDVSHALRGRGFSSSRELLELQKKPRVIEAMVMDLTIVPLTDAPTSAPMTDNFTPLIPLGQTDKSTWDIIAAVALEGGQEFGDYDSYQSKALAFAENLNADATDNELITYYVLACIYFASNRMPNKRTQVTIPDVESLPGWANDMNWLSDASPCEWHGVGCDIFGDVISLRLDSNNMTGIFAPEVQLLGRSLEVIDLYNNPYLVTEGDDGNSWLAKMSSLRFLYISATSFEYEGIPTFLSSLSNLEELDVSNSRYTQGPIRTEAFEGMSKLSYLDLGQNVYTSTIPETLTVLPNLEQLYLDDTLFTVNMTLNFLTQMDLLREFWMDNTVVMTSIPSEIGRLSNLASLSMTFCGLTGTLPSEIGLLTVLDRLWLRQNLLQGSIPDNIAGLENLKYFYIEGNRLGGSIPVGICDKRAPQGSLAEIGADCDSDNQYLVACPCCSCCGPFQCYDFGLDTGNNI